MAIRSLISRPVRRGGKRRLDATEPVRSRRWLWVWPLVRRHPAAAVSGAFMALFLIACFIAPLIAPYGPLSTNLALALQGPSSAHLLGTDSLGRDVLSRLLYGGQPTAIGVAEMVGVALLLGVPAGAIAGYTRGTLDSVLGRVADILLAVPQIVILLLIFTLAPTDETAAMLALGVIISPGLYRVTRAAAMQAAEETYVRSAEVSGLRRSQIVAQHILPVALGPIVVNTAIIAAAGLIIEAGIQFLGLGVVAPNPSWGAMLQEAEQVLGQQPWLIVPPTLAIGVCIVALVTFGDGLRDAFAERTQARAGGAEQSLDAPREAATGVGSLAEEPQKPDPTALLSVRGLSVSLASQDGRLPLLTNIGFDVSEGETVAVVGESGCGKSLLARAILGLLPARIGYEGGSCVFDGRDLMKLTGREFGRLRGRDIALMSQDPMVSLDPCYTVGNQIAEVMRRHTGRSKSERRARSIELLRAVGMPDPERTLRQYPHELSGGMAQRVALAVAMAGEPRLLVADEPTTSLDVVVQAEILSLIKERQAATGLSIVLITHDLNLVAQYCDRMVVLYAGDVVEIGSVVDVAEGPLHPYTSGLVSCSLRDVRVGEAFPTIPGAVPQVGQWPVGCRFAGRCPIAIDACWEPGARALQLRDGDRPVRCIRAGELSPSAFADLAVGAVGVSDERQ